MANRPRRPRSSSGPQGGEGTPTPEATDEAGSSAVGSPAEPSERTDGEPQAAPASPDRRNGDALPPPESQPAASPSSIAQQRGAEDSRTSDAEPDADRDQASGPQSFAAEEGLAAKAGAPDRRHLGEFEDDDTLTSGEAAPARPAGATDAFDRPEMRPSADETQAGSATGSRSLVGAGLAGGVLALVGAALLASTGLWPGAGGTAQTPGQYASAGDMEAMSSELETLRGTVEQLQSAQAAGGSGGDFASTQDLAALGDRLTAAEQAVQDAGADDGSAEAIQSAQSAAESAQSAAESAQSAADAAQGAADSAQGAADSAQTEIAELGSRLDAQDERFAGLEQANEEARLALAAAGLKAAIDRGGPFAPELDTFASAGGGQAADDLRPFAEEGVPTRAELVEEWPQAEADIRRAMVQPDADAGVGDQLLAGLSSLVTVRSSGEPAEDDTGADAALSRMNAAMEAGDLDAWSDAHGSLDPALQAASEDFAGRVAARRQATSIVDSALAGAAGGAPGTEG